MRQAGEVTYADAHKPRRNEGCVEFASERVSLSWQLIESANWNAFQGFVSL